MPSKENTEVNNTESSPKKPYNTPKMLDYGHIRDITRNLGGMTGANDGGGGKDKTGP